jgi:hypothetical protein
MRRATHSAQCYPCNMPPEVGARPVNPARSLPRFALVLIVGITLGAFAVISVGFLLASRHPGSAFFNHAWSTLTGRTLNIDVTQPTVVNRIQKLQRLETVVYTMDKVVTGAKENRVFPDFLAGDRLLMMVHGEVVAGIDFSNLKSGDVKVHGRAVQLHLPAPEVFSTRIDNDKTRVYSRQTGLLVPTDPNLETQVRQEAERQLQESALNGGILQTAQQNATSTITSLLQGLGFDRIEFN